MAMKNMTPTEIADEAIGMFLEEIDRRIAERDPADFRQILRDLVDDIFPAARAAAVREVQDAQDFDDLPGEGPQEKPTGIRVTCKDLSGEQETSSIIIDDDYVCVCAGSCYVDNTQMYPGTGTHVLTIKGRK